MDQFLWKNKKDIVKYCTEKFVHVEKLYSDYIAQLNTKRVKVCCEFFYCERGIFLKNIKKNCSVIMCISLYPSELTLEGAEEIYKCQKIYSIIGKIKTANEICSLKFNIKKDPVVIFFFKHYIKKIETKGDQFALCEKITDSIRSIILVRRYRSNAKLCYHGFNYGWIVLVILLITLVLLGLHIPVGYRLPRS